MIYLWAPLREAEADRGGHEARKINFYVIHDVRVTQ